MRVRPKIRSYMGTSRIYRAIKSQIYKGLRRKTARNYGLMAPGGRALGKGLFL